MGRPIDRRTALLALGVVGLAGCAARPTQPPAAAPTATAPATATTPATPSPVAMPTPTPAPPDPAAVAARYQEIVPTAWGMHLPGIVSQLATVTDEDGAALVALSFDACGGPGGSQVDRALIDGLRAGGVSATLFLNQRWIEAHPALAAELAADPLFLLANHGTRHRPLSVAGSAAYGIRGTGSAAEAVDEVWGNHLVLTEVMGHPPRHFRAGTAHYDDVAVQIVRELGEIPVGFSVNGDGGASYSADKVRGEFGRATAGGIVLAHMNQPGGGTAQGALAAVTDLRARGIRFVHVDA